MNNIVFAGGGTGGHVYPALALANEFKAKGFACHFVGTKLKIEAKLVPKMGFPISFIWISGFQRSLKLRNLLFPIKVLRALWQSRKILKKLQPSLVIGTGGYVSGPVLYMAAKLGIPCLIQEQNSFPGITTKLLEKYVDEVHIAYDYAKQFLKSNHVFSSGNPVRKFEFSAAKPTSFADMKLEDRLSIGIMGGSLGARTINQVIAQIVSESNFFDDKNLIWQTGKTTFDEFKNTNTPHAKIIAYIDNIQEFYEAVDIIVCRAGAISLAELALSAKPAIIVPYKFSAEDHQTHNAEVFKSAKAAFVFTDDNKLKKDVFASLEKLTQDENLRSDMTKNMKKLAKADATKIIVKHGLELINKSLA